MTSEGAENFFPQYLGINISFSHLYRISKTNSCHKCATALKPAKKKKKKETSAFHRVGRGEEVGGRKGEEGEGEEGRGWSRGRGGGGGGREEKGGGGRGAGARVKREEEEEDEEEQKGDKG